MGETLLSTLVALDTSLFFLVNQKWSSPWLDPFFIFFTLPSQAGVLAFLLLGLTLIRSPRFRALFLGLALSIGCADLISSRLIKKWVRRPRPCVTHEKEARLPIGQTHSFSFPSSHAANTFAAAGFLTPAYPPFAPLFLTLAGIVALSRVYLGVHYPLDVLAGGLLGLTLGLLGFYLWQRFYSRSPPAAPETKRTDPKAFEIREPECQNSKNSPGPPDLDLEE